MQNYHQLSYTYSTKFDLMLSLRLKSPGINWVLGENGSGKSTLLKLLAGILPSSKSTIKNFYIDNSSTACLLDGAGFYQNLSLTSHLKLFAQYLDLNPDEISRTIGNWHLQSCKGIPFAKLSSGQIARSLLLLTSLGKPSHLLLDEPEKNLDEQGMNMLESQINRWRQQNSTVVISSHTVPGIHKRDQVTVLQQGRSLFSGSVQMLLQQHMHTPYTPIILLKRLFKP